MEDEVAYLQILNCIFSGAGHRVYEAHGGREAMNVVNQHHLDIVVTDHIMRPVSGLELVSQIKKRPDLAHLKIIMVTGDNSLETMMQAADVQVDGYIVKPFDSLAIISKLDQVISGVANSGGVEMCRSQTGIQPENAENPGELK